MRALMITAGTLIFAAGFVAGGHLERPVGAQGFTVTMDCGASSAPQVRTTLYFGLARPKGAVTELEWQLFLRDEVTSRFPDGLTVAYRKTFEQQSVLWESARVCGAA